MSLRSPAAVPVALLAVVVSISAAQAADPPPYRYTANYIGLLSPGGVPGGATGMRLTESGSVFGYAPVLTQSLTIGSFAAFEWKAGVLTPQFTLPASGTGALVSPPRDVSSTGVFVGYDTTTNTAWARQGATEQILPTLPNTAAGSQALQVNGAGTIVGVHFIQGPAGTIGEPIRWEFGSSTATAMSMPTDFRTSSGVGFRDINEAGVAVGRVNASPTLQRATVWDATTARFLPSLSSFAGTPTRSDAVDVNEFGAVAGNSDLLASNGTSLGRRAVTWSADGELTSLGTLSTRTNGFGSSDAVAINDGGDVIGSYLQYSASNANLGARGFIWDAEAGQMRALGTLGAAEDGTAQSSALGLNNQGFVVGTSDLYEQIDEFLIDNQGPRAVLADPGAGFVDLNNLVDPASLTFPDALRAVVLNSAFAINERGWILASSTTGCTGSNCLWLLTPYGEPLDPPVVPVPAAALLLGSGLAALLATRRRRIPGTRA